MKLNKSLYLVYPLILWALLIGGCATGGGFTPQGAVIAHNAVTVAQGFLSALNGFYGDLLNLQMVPDYTVPATQALSIADVAAVSLHAIIDAGTATQQQLNVAAGQVVGAQAILKQIKK
jgi:hypothetical protein